MIEIPNQLKKINARFVKCSVNKVPIEEKWTTTNNYGINEFDKNTQVYGVLCGHNNLIVVDVDKKYIQDKLMQVDEFKSTFICQTALKRLYHFYFIVKNIPEKNLHPYRKQPQGYRIDNNKGERVIDVQGCGTQVIGASSIIGEKRYDVVNDNEIKTIDYNFLMVILSSLEDGISIFQPETKKKIELGEGFLELDPICQEIKDRVSPKDIMPEKYIDKNPTMCPLGHSSIGQKCFSYNDKVWFCHHCRKTGNVFHLYMQMHKCTFQTAKYELAKIANITDNLRVKVFQLLEKKQSQQATELIAKKILSLYKIKTIRNDKEPEMWIYSKGIYKPEARTYIRQFIRKLLETSYTNTFSNRVIDKIITDSYVEQSEFFITEDITKIPVGNGILNLKTRELEHYSDEYIFFSKLPVYYDDKIDFKDSNIDKFLHDILQDGEDVKTIQEIFGYCLYRSNFLEKAFMFLGKGRNGKSKLNELIKRFVGAENCSGVTLEELEYDKFSAFNLMNKMVNLASDLSKTTLKKTGMFKKTTGNDFMTVSRKFLPSVNFINHAKMIFACNDLPMTYDESDGFWDRWDMIDFKYKFVDNPIKEYEKKIDKRIIDKLTSDKEMSGLLNFALDGLDRLLKNGKLTKSTSTKEMQRQWKRKSSSFNAFFEDYLEVSATGTVLVSDLNVSYFKYCEKYKITIARTSVKKGIMNSKGCESKGKYHSESGTTKYLWEGVKFKDVIDDDIYKKEVEISMGDIE